MTFFSFCICISPKGCYIILVRYLNSRMGHCLQKLCRVKDFFLTETVSRLDFPFPDSTNKTQEKHHGRRKHHTIELDTAHDRDRRRRRFSCAFRIRRGNLFTACRVLGDYHSGKHICGKIQTSLRLFFCVWTYWLRDIFPRRCCGMERFQPKTGNMTRFRRT